MNRLRTHLAETPQPRILFGHTTSHQRQLRLRCRGCCLIVAEEFRDGNAAAHTGLLRVAKQAYAALPESVRERMFRGAAACYERATIPERLEAVSGR